MEILTWAQRKTIIQTQFVSVVSKVISDFQWTVLKIKNVGKIKNVKNVKKRALNKKRKKKRFYIYDFYNTGARTVLANYQGLLTWRLSTRGTGVTGLQTGDVPS